MSLATGSPVLNSNGEGQMPQLTLTRDEAETVQLALAWWRRHLQRRPGGSLTWLEHADDLEGAADKLDRVVPGTAPDFPRRTQRPVTRGRDKSRYHGRGGYG